MVTILEGTYTDGTSSTDISKVLKSKVDKNGKLSVTADRSLLPVFDTSQTVELTQDEKDDIRTDAIKQCGSSNDTACITSVSNRASTEKLNEKINEKQNADKVTGERVVVNYIDAFGRLRTLTVPKGQTIVLGDDVKKSESSAPDWGFFKSSATIITAILTPFFIMFWVLSIGTTWRTLIDSGYTKPAYFLTALSVVVPFSGFITTPIFLKIMKSVE